MRERSVARAMVIAGAMALVAIVVGLPRTPVVWSDEIIFAASGYERTRSGTSIPSHLVDIDDLWPMEAFYGPVYFRALEATIGVFGLGLWSVRGIGLAAAVAAAAATFWLTRTLGGSSRAAAMAAALLVLTPDVGSAATNGRMDMLAAAFAVVTLASLAAALTTSHPVARLVLAGAAGTALGLAVLTTPRAAPLAAGLAIASPLALWRAPSELRPRVTVLAVTFAAAATLVVVWMTGAHGSPLGWWRFLTTHTFGDTINAGPVLGGVRLGTLLTPSALGTAWALAASVVVVASGARGAVVRYLLAAVWLLAIGYALLVSNAFLRSAYLGIPLVATAAAVAASRIDRPMVLAAVSAGALAFLVVRGVKLTELAQTWAARDHGALEAFFRQHVPAGSAVIGYDQFYFYAIERAGSYYRGYAVVPGMDTAVRSTRYPDTTPQRFAQRFLVWPELDDVPFLPEYDCARRTPVARYDPPRAEPLPLVGRLPWLTRYAAWRAYPPSTLYAVDRDCRLEIVSFRDHR